MTLNLQRHLKHSKNNMENKTVIVDQEEIIVDDFGTSLVSEIENARIKDTPDSDKNN